MEVVIQPTAAAAADLVARVIAGELRAKPGLVLGLATGRTMEAVYDWLVRFHQGENSPDSSRIEPLSRSSRIQRSRASKNSPSPIRWERAGVRVPGPGLDFSSCRTFNLDEYVGLSGTDPRSYRHYMDHHLFRRVNIDRRNTHVPDGLAADLEAECARYESLIAGCGGIDLQLLGIGMVGHLGFNEPVSSLRSRTRDKLLSPATLKQNAPLFGGLGHMPRRAITMGVGTILDTRRCLLLAVGRDKAAIVASAVEGPVTSMISATALQMHPACVVVVDAAAGSRLKQAAYYQWIFDNEPKWDAFRQPAAGAIPIGKRNSAVPKRGGAS